MMVGIVRLTQIAMIGIVTMTIGIVTMTIGIVTMKVGTVTLTEAKTLGTVL